MIEFHLGSMVQLEWCWEDETRCCWSWLTEWLNFENMNPLGLQPQGKFVHMFSCHLCVCVAYCIRQWLVTQPFPTTQKKQFKPANNLHLVTAGKNPASKPGSIWFHRVSSDQRAVGKRQPATLCEDVDCSSCCIATSRYHVTNFNSSNKASLGGRTPQRSQMLIGNGSTHVWKKNKKNPALIL